MDELLSFDDILANNNLTGEQKKQAIEARSNKYMADLDRQKWLDIGRGGLGSVISGYSFHPVLNIPYVGTGLGGAMYEAGQAITEGEKLPEIAKRAGTGFFIGETVGAIPYVGKGANKLSGGRIGNVVNKGLEKVNPLVDKVKTLPAVQKIEDALMTDLTGKIRKGYHGTKYQGNIEKFDENLIGQNTGNEGYSGRGFYFSTDSYEASTYGDNILKRYIETKKPFIANRENIAKYAENFGYTKEPVGIDQEWLLNSLKNKDEKAYKLANEIIKNGEEKGWDNFLSKYGGEDNILNLNSVGSWANATKLSNSNYKEPLSDYIINDLAQNLGTPKTINDFKYLPNLDYMLDLGKSSRAFTDMLKKDGYDSVINGTEIVAFSPEQIKSGNLADYLLKDSALTKGYRDNKANIDKFFGALTTKFPSIKHYKNPTENFRLPNLNDADLKLLGKEQKPVVIKPNIVIKNKTNHPELDINDYNGILENGLYNAKYLLNTEPIKKPNYYNFIAPRNGYNDHVLIELNVTKDNYEIVGWHIISDKGLKAKIKNANKNGGQSIITDR